MSTETDISALYREFTDALTEVLAENAVGLARRGRLARARAAVKEAPWIYRTCIFFGGGDRIQELGSHAKCRSLGAAWQLGRCHTSINGASDLQAPREHWLRRTLRCDEALAIAEQTAFDAKAGPSGPCGGPAGNVRSVKFSALARFITVIAGHRRAATGRAGSYLARTG
jgi:hypothetical protein